MGLPHRPSPAGTVRPLDGRIANVHRIRSRRQILDAQRVLESRLLKCRIPPQRARAGSRAHRLWDSPIEIKYDRLDRLTQRCIRIFLLQTPAVDQVSRKQAIVSLGAILKAEGNKSEAGIL